ncbi:hypothetical protein [Tenacibaculum sp. IB213877]|uniref:hypothetical protein n=1 Tax=Tenacibaculum sp. IB213877 TaxID=3097351 RepID=UPI002A5A4294|nr:hypothetical protein [Tenacibaculum sp. IB213877]MDY0781185.1 hypothetical protein [Tenacibaculum sp. IB213877]
MKIMLKKKYISILLTTLFISCAVDDDPAVIPSGTVITASFDKSGDVFVFPSSGSEATVSIILSEAVETTSQFNYTINEEEKSITLNAGETTAEIVVPNQVGNVSSIILTSANTLYNNSIRLGAQTSVKLISVPAASDSAINIVLSLNSPTDVFFSFAEFNSEGEWQQDIYGVLGTSFSIPLNAGIQNSVDLYPNYYALDVFTDVLTESGYTIYVVYPDSSVEIFSGNDLTLDGYTDQDVVWVNVEDDPNDPSNKLFTFTQN